ncbi:hypothetical protein CK203_060214 [Vitis vinifera]|uniref:Uncharacterized protein n=1 Tax=Vitis vinifera TaxID=29760 RepID=A0A438FS28_VITVI|nr:hypothetical protein CK203_060214 [Vitis vinifera]
MDSSFLLKRTGNKKLYSFQVQGRIDPTNLILRSISSPWIKGFILI